MGKTNLEEFFKKSSEEMKEKCKTTDLHEETAKDEATAEEKVARTWSDIAATTSTEDIPPEYVDPVDHLGADYLHNRYVPLPTPRYTGIRFDGFMSAGPAMSMGYANPNYNKDIEKYNKRIEFIMKAYTGDEIARLSETTLMSSKEDLEKYIKLLTSLLDGGLCDIE
jgi:hypothetical protein